MNSVGRVVNTISIFLAITCYVISDPTTYVTTTDLLNPRQFSRSTESHRTSILVANYNNASTHNPEELGEYFEGDIRVPYRPDAKLALLAGRFRWPNAVVPYTINGRFSDEELTVIKWAMDEFRKKTCINFKPRSGEKDYVSIVSGQSGCWAAAGRIGGKQEVNLQTPACLWKRGVVLHELMHAVGFLHEHNRHDRDDYVTIQMQNIDKNKQFNFKKYPKAEADGLGHSYDYASVMHYSAKSFSKNGRTTITAKKNTEDARRMGQRDGFSTMDIAKLRSMYKC